MVVRTLNIYGTSYPIRGLFVAFAALTMMISISAQYSFGNLNTYMISYMKARVDENLTYADFIFISQGRAFLSGLTSFLGGMVARRIGLKTTLIIGCVIFSGGYTVTYFSLDAGLWACVFSLAFCSGIGMSLLYANIVTATMKWFPGKTGLMGSICVAGFGYGSVIWNPLETAYVNPNNIEAEEVPGEIDKYFLDDEVLDRIPSLFLVLGATFASMQLISLFLLREPTEDELEEIKALHREEERARGVVEKKAGEKGEEKFSLNAKQALQTSVFWKMWLGNFSLGILMNFMGSYQKSYGMLYINDDAFLAICATLQNVMNGSSRILWGSIFDCMGYRSTLFVVGTLSAAITFSFINISLFDGNEAGAKAFFLISVTALYGVLPGYVPCFPPQFLKAFGPKHTSTIYGLIFSTSVATSIILTIYTQTVFEVIGYEWTFVIFGIFATLGSIVTFSYPANVTSEDFRERFGKEKKVQNVTEEQREESRF